MPKRFALVPTPQLDELAFYHQDIMDSLCLYFSPSAPTFAARFLGKSAAEVRRELDSRLNESDVRSTFVVLTSLEATFKVDFDVRCRKRLKDNLSIYFREVEKKRKDAVRLNEDILEGWKRHEPLDTSGLISDLRGAFKLRHWLAHGRYWNPKLGRKYDFAYVQVLAINVSRLPFAG